MSRHPLSILVSIVLAAPLLAQEGPPGPAPELKKLAVFEGTWKGSGTAMMAPGGAASPWTSRTTYSWAMNGHFLEENTIIEAEGMPAPMVFHGYLGWDREKQRYVFAMVNNMGEAQLGEMHWLDDKTMVSMFKTHREGLPGLEHSVSKIEGDTITFEMSALQGAGPMAKIVEGKMTKVADAQPVAMEASHTAVPAPPEMGKLEKICGTYSLEGEMIPAPGAPAMSVTGEEALTPIFGGAAIEMRIHGEAEGMPGAYEAWGTLSWDAGANCYRHLVVDNMGMIGESEGRWMGEDTILHTAAGMEFGMPVVARTMVHLKADGSIDKVVAHGILGNMDPVKTFEATYTKK